MKKLFYFLLLLISVNTFAQPYPSRPGNAKQLLIRDDGWQFRNYIGFPIIDSAKWYPGYSNVFWISTKDTMLKFTDPKTGLTSGIIDSVKLKSSSISNNVHADSMAAVAITKSNAHADSIGISVTSGVKSIFPTDTPTVSYSVYRAYRTGTYTQFKDSSGASIVIDTTSLQYGYVDLVKKSSYFVKQPAPSNFAVFVNKSTDIVDNFSIGSNLANPALIVPGKLIDNTGAIASVAGYKMIKIQWPSTAVQGDAAVFGRITSNHTTLYCRYYDSLGTLISSVFQYTQGVTRSVGVPLGGAKGGVYITIRAVEDTNDSGFSQCTFNMGTTLLTPYTPYVETHWVKQIDKKNLQAKYIDSNSICPTPISDVNTSNKKYVDDAKNAAIAYTNSNAVLNTNIGIETDFSDNLANPALIESNKVVDNTGAYVTATGFKSIVIPIDSTMLNIAWKGINSLRSSLYGRFYNASGAGLGSLINTVPNGSAYTRSIPAGSTKVIYTIRAPEDSNDLGFSTLMVNYGTVAITPFVAYSKDYVTSINGKDLKSGSGEAYNQRLNTTDNVQFNSVVTPLMTASALYFNSLPVYANDAAADADTGLQSGSLYKLTGNRNVFQKP